jgi:hypothetical protein
LNKKKKKTRTQKKEDQQKLYDLRCSDYVLTNTFTTKTRFQSSPGRRHVFQYLLQNSRSELVRHQ